jgi:hypothetical protein
MNGFDKIGVFMSFKETKSHEISGRYFSSGACANSRCS